MHRANGVVHTHNIDGHKLNFWKNQGQKKVVDKVVCVLN